MCRVEFEKMRRAAPPGFPGIHPAGSAIQPSDFPARNHCPKEPAPGHPGPTIVHPVSGPNLPPQDAGKYHVVHAIHGRAAEKPDLRKPGTAAPNLPATIVERRTDPPGSDSVIASAGISRLRHFSIRFPRAAAEPCP